MSHSTPPDGDVWPDLTGVRVDPSRVRIAPGIYEARSAQLEAFTAFRRRCLALYFDIYDGSFADGHVVGRVPMFFRLPPNGKRLAPSSKLARLFDLLQPRRRRLDRLPMNELRDKLWRVRVGDVTTSGG